MRFFEQIFAISWLNLRTLPNRLGSSFATLIGVAGVVVVVVGVLSMAVGFEKTLSSTGDAERVLIMRGGSTDEMSSGLDFDETRIVSDAPGLAKRGGTTLASAELYVIVDLLKRGSGTEANVPLRGVSPAAFDVRGGVEIVEGRRFEPGRNEIIAGSGAAQEFEGLTVGNDLRWGQNSWKVVGIFDAGGTVEDSEIWTDARVLQPAYRRGNSYQSVHARLSSAQEFEAFKDALTTDPRLDVMVEKATDYYSGQSQALTQTIKALGLVIGLLMGFGAIFGALNTMYTAVSARTREIATLRALGFSTFPVVISVLVESLMLAAIGGLMGAGTAYLAFNGLQTATLNFQTFSQVTFAFAVTPPLMIGGIAYALLMGIVGGFFPAMRAARLPVATALREL